MAPEQARGQSIDKRADIWAFGVVFYEMLSGRRPFEGKTIPDILAAVTNTEPDWTLVPRQAAGLLKACLEKDRRQRLRDIGDAPRLLMDVPDTPAPMAARRFWWIVAGVALAAVLGGWTIAHRFTSQSNPDAGVQRFTIAPPENVSYGPGSISPDGRWFAFIGVDGVGKSQLWVRRFDSLTAQALAPAEHWPFWSPDSRFIAFKQGGILKRIEPAGGTPQTICNADLEVGGSWSRQGTILFSTGSVIMQVASGGGEAKPLTKLIQSRRETAHDFPVFLPDGRHFIYVIRGQDKENRGLFLGSLDSPGDRVRLLDEVSNSWYSPAPRDSAWGYLLFGRGEKLLGQRFNTSDFRLQGETFVVLDKIVRASSSGFVSVSASKNGVLAAGPPYMGEQVTWFDRKGIRLGTVGHPTLHFFPQISPDGQTVVDDPVDWDAGASYVWFFPAVGGTARRFTFLPSNHPIWSPDGRRIAYGLMSSALYMKTAAGLESEDLVLEAARVPANMNGDDYRQPCDWSNDGKLLLYTEIGERDRYALWSLPLLGDRKPKLWLKNEFNNRCGALSPDGRWIAYASDEPGRFEIYVQAFAEKMAGTGRKWQVSYSGGTWPKWRRDGKELFFLDTDRDMVAVPVKTADTFEHGTPQTLFPTGIMTPDSRFDVTSDGRRFLIPTEVRAGSTPVTVVVNWMKAAGL
jgi:Tol biopolymer transport system component